MQVKEEVWKSLRRKREQRIDRKKTIILVEIIEVLLEYSNAYGRTSHRPFGHKK